MMGSKTEFDFYKKLLHDGEVRVRSIPKIVVESSVFSSLNNGNPDAILLKVKSGRGSKICVNPDRFTDFENIFNVRFPESVKEGELTKVDLVNRYKDSKALNVKSDPIFFFRGKVNYVEINGSNVNISEYTSKYKLFSSALANLCFPRICIVENKDVFLEAEKLFGDSFLFVHKYGRLGVNDAKLFNADTMVVFPDYDYIGLNDFLNIKSFHSTTTLHLPENFESLFKKYAKPLGNQVPSAKVKESKDEMVKYVRSFIERTGSFLEQQSLLIGV